MKCHLARRAQLFVCILNKNIQKSVTFREAILWVLFMILLFIIMRLETKKKKISKILIWGHILFCTFFCFYYCTLCLAQFFTANELYVALDNRL